MRHRGWQWGFVALASVGAVLLGATPASAEGPVAVTSSGPASITTSSDTSTGRIVATFTVTDASLTATGATICRSWGDNKKQGCTYRRFDSPPVDDYGDPIEEDEYTRWDVVGAPGAWTVSYPIGFDPITREQCLDAGWLHTPFYAAIEVQNDAGVVLATSSWRYAVVCTGLEAGSTAPAKTRVYAGRSARSKSFRFFVLDTKHVLDTYRICQWNPVLEKYGTCDLEDLVSRNRTDTGWFISYSLSWPPMGSATCSWIGRKWPSAGFRLDLYRGTSDKEITVYGTTRLDC